MLSRWDFFSVAVMERAAHSRRSEPRWQQPTVWMTSGRQEEQQETIPIAIARRQDGVCVALEWRTPQVGADVASTSAISLTGKMTQRSTWALINVGVAACMEVTSTRVWLCAPMPQSNICRHRLQLPRAPVGSWLAHYWPPAARDCHALPPSTKKIFFSLYFFSVLNNFFYLTKIKFGFYFSS